MRESCFRDEVPPLRDGRAPRRAERREVWIRAARRPIMIASSFSGEWGCYSGDSPMARPRPIYITIAEELRKEIISRPLRPHTRLPSEPELVQRYGAARETVRRALARLQDQGMIYSRQAVGSFVAEPRVE